MATLREMKLSVGRELGMRRACYPRWIKSEKMSQAKADAELDAMDSLYKLLTALLEARNTTAHMHNNPQVYVMLKKEVLWP